MNVCLRCGHSQVISLWLNLEIFPDRPGKVGFSRHGVEVVQPKDKLDNLHVINAVFISASRECLAGSSVRLP